MIDKYEEFYKHIFKKKDNSESDNILVIDNNNFINGSIVLIKEFLIWGEINKQNCLVLTENPEIYTDKFPLVNIKKDDRIIINHSKNSKKVEFIKIVDINQKSEEDEEGNNMERKILNLVKDFHDNNLLDMEDKRLFRVVIDTEKVFSVRLLHNLKNYSRKTNLSIMVKTSCQNLSNKFYFYFDKIFNLEDLDFNMEETNGIVKILKNQHIDVFSMESVYGLGSKKVFFWGIKKTGSLNFRDIDITGII
jgi:hypothetical protein